MFQVDHSALTGESIPVPRSVDATDNRPTATENLAFFFTSCVEGKSKSSIFICAKVLVP